MVKLQVVKPTTKIGAFLMNSQSNLHNFDEITKTIKDKKDVICDTLFDMIKPFTIGTLAAKSNMVKEKGFRPCYLITLLMLFPFFDISAVRSFFLSGYAYLSEAQKDTIFRQKNNPKFNCRGFLSTGSCGYLLAKC